MHNFSWLSGFNLIVERLHLRFRKNSRVQVFTTCCILWHLKGDNLRSSLPSSVSCPEDSAPGWCGWTPWRVCHGGPWRSLSAPSISPRLEITEWWQQGIKTLTNSPGLAWETDKRQLLTIVGDFDSLTAENGLHSVKQKINLFYPLKLIFNTDAKAMEVQAWHDMILVRIKFDLLFFF